MSTISKPKRTRTKTAPEHYVNPKVLEQSIQDYYDNGLMSNELCESIMKIANKLSYSPNFRQYSFRDEMVEDAIEKMITAIINKVYKFNPNKLGKNGKAGNAFMYFTKIAYHAMVNRIKIENKNATAIDNYREEMYERIMMDSENGNMVKTHRPSDESGGYE